MAAAHSIGSTDSGARDEGLVHVLLIDQFDDGLAVAIGRCLLIDGGFDVHTISGDEHSSLRHSKKATVSHAELATKEQLLAAVRSYAAEHPVDVILPVQETMILLVGHAEQELRAIAPVGPHPDPELCARVDDKGTFHTFAEAAGLPMPKAWPATALTDSADEIRAWAGPLLIKPCTGWGGSGIRRFDDGNHLLTSVERGEVDWGPGPEAWIVEQFIDGVDASASLLAHEGRILSVSIKRSAIEQTKAFKSAGLMNEYFRDEGISKTAAAFARASGWSGPAHLDFRIAPNGSVYLLEVNPRFWQTTLGALKTGLNYPVMACRIARGELVDEVAGTVAHSINLPLLVSNWGYLPSLMRNPVRAWRAINVEAIRADPAYELVQLKTQLRVQVKRKLDALRGRIALGGRR